MMQRLVDTVLGNAKESIKTFTQESFQYTVRVINGFSALVLAFMPGKGPALDGIESHSTFRAPRMPRWMEEGVSSFNTFLTEYDSDSGSGSESEYASGVEDSDYNSTAPPSPSSECSHLSRAGSSGRRHRRSKTLLERLLLWMLWPLRLWSRLWRSGSSETRRSNSGGLRRLARRWSGSREFAVPKSVADRRRGIIEDLQLVMELLIERVFDVVHKIVHQVLSPFNTVREFLHWAFFRDTSYDDDTDTAEMATLGDSHAHPHRQKPVPQQPLNTDSRTCQDIITSLGYPYEAHRVTTDDGHVLLLERIPRRESRKAVILQHGVLDSSLSWVSNGVVGSQAFAAFDQGYDVYLGNLRGLASREHVDKHVSPKKYWNFSINEHGTQDIPAMVTKIHELKMLELLGPVVAQMNGETGGGDDVREISTVQDASVEDWHDPQEEEELLPYRLCGVAHSLGGATMLMYVVTKRLARQPHYLSRLILLSPAGFHGDAPLSVKVAQRVVPLVADLLYLVTPGIYIPTRFFRGLFNKLSRDFQNYPALGGLAQALLSYLIGGDSSNWVGAIGLSHYNMNNMPGVSVKVAVHFAQMANARRFLMYDFGSPELNLQAYGAPAPLDIGANYGAIDIPVDVVAGHKDRLIPATMVRKHFHAMEAAGCQASYAEFEFAHLDFTFANHEELMAYVTSRLSLVAPIVPGALIPPLEETPSSRRLTGSLSSSAQHHNPDLLPDHKRPRIHSNGNTSSQRHRNGEVIPHLEEVPEMMVSPTSLKLKST